MFVPLVKPSLSVCKSVLSKSEWDWLGSQSRCTGRPGSIVKHAVGRARQSASIRMQQSNDGPSSSYNDDAAFSGDENPVFEDNDSPDGDSSQLQFREILVDNLSPEVIHEHFQMMIDEAEKKFKFNPNLWAGVPILNTVMLTGRLGRDPEFSKSKTGLSICNFSLAVSRDKPITCELNSENLVDWFNVRTFGKLAETVHKLAKKGLRVGITGRVDVNTWTGRDGVKRENVVVSAKTFEVLQSKSEPSFSPGMPNESGRRESKQKFNTSDPSLLDNYITDDDEPLGDLPF